MLIWNHDILGAKNILPFPYTYGSGTNYGLTITVHEDGSITAQGTPTQTIMFLINDNIIENLSLWQGSEMIFSEWEVQNQNAFAALLLGQSTPISEVRGDYKLTVTSEMIQQGVAFILYFGNGVDLTTPITFKPMIRLATDPDHTWRSPALTNKQLTDSVFYLSYAKSHVSANPSTTTGVLNGLEIDGVGYAVQGGDESGKYDKITQSGVGSCICDGQSEYFKIATLTITETNINGPIGFEVSQTFNQVTLLQIGFAKTDDTDPDIAWFYTNQRNNYWIVKENTSVWGLYGQFENTVDGCSLHRIVGYRVNNGVTVTVNLTNVSALPSGATQPTYGGSVNYANIANRAASATDSTKVAKAGDTMTGQLKTSFKESVAMGSYEADANTIPNLVNELRYSSGCCGSVSITTAYSGSPSSVPTGWYNFLWIPHRSGGVNGAADGDNCNYGRLFLRGMTVNGEFEIRYSNNSISYCRELISSANIGSQSVNYANSAGSATKASILDGFGSGGAGNFTWGNQTGTGIWRNNDGSGGEFGFRKNNPSSGQVSMVIDGTVYVNEGRYQVWDKGSLTNLNQLTNGPGYITGINKTMVTNALGYTPPTKDTNDAVKQTNCGTNNWNLRVLLSGAQDDTERTSSVYKSQDLQYNPYWKALYIGSNNRTWGMIYAQGNQQLNISASAEENYRLFLGVRESTWSLAPLYNQYLKLGTGSFKWNQIYSSSATINTSDRRKKKDIQPLDENARIFVMKLNPVSYKLKDGETGRTHYGMIAQDIEDELTELGMTAMDFAGFCKDEVYENVKTTKEGFTEVKTIKKPGEYIYGLRYEEFIAPLIKTVQLQQQEIEELKHRIDILEGK